MKIIEREIEKNGEKVFICMDEVLLTEYEVGRFDESQIRYLVAWMKKNRPEIICPIMCEDCPEHIAQKDYENYCINKMESGPSCRK
jgi:hypothetical protein